MYTPYTIHSYWYRFVKGVVFLDAHIMASQFKLRETSASWPADAIDKDGTKTHHIKRIYVKKNLQQKNGRKQIQIWMPNTRLNLSLSFSELLTSSLAIESSEHSPGCQPAVQHVVTEAVCKNLEDDSLMRTPGSFLVFFGGKTKVPTCPMRSMILVLPGIFARHLLGIHWALTGLWTLEWVARCPHQSSHGIFDPEHTASCCPTHCIFEDIYFDQKFVYICMLIWKCCVIHLAVLKFRERPPLDAWWWV